VTESSPTAVCDVTIAAECDGTAGLVTER